ncbi:MAG: protein-L-isoaspartate(D-aspartate) O-methyltransferase [Gammaproteobacteria bacterium]|jgi:protein-L-isoaspartate(D-aspartate) O-methyltransferase|nr:protein-L-isoaspartate(D-aspartate) O-methyltransferase [Gammaproteobacteria bacterium]NBT45908.1 protein-L-isoaspartate(D-aspartate) O-methyltransferase [Gammaproteobacteria bacterium]NBY23533.1 protein-L-isoaspartate(D-aspartate) O-methyltransferase [Gammaproteobacteria bacterium]NDE34475.1 protein-L-isoaspartate(D-aspartate) O-methyltransferase [Gammaproteobacteria bacterium]NDE56152.1 protein-L-isoaspartate(D-aspartate) O-methyltransferase [Gammaproteobacteria bacterium]
MNQRIEGIGMTSRRTRERMIARLKELGISHPDLLRVMLETPRHLFVEEALQSRAYEDTALPIGFNQTISQPYIVARMTELLLEWGPLDKVLEVGTGSGYQTAILAQLAKRVHSVERIYPLQQRARRCLQDLKLRNVRLKHSDGGWGWEEYAPYDAILVAAAPSEIPETLLAQMGRRSIMIIPVGQGRTQILHRVTRTEVSLEVEEIEPVNFVPFLPGVL